MLSLLGCRSAPVAPTCQLVPDRVHCRRMSTRATLQAAGHGQLHLRAKCLGGAAPRPGMHSHLRPNMGRQTLSVRIQEKTGTDKTRMTERNTRSPGPSCVQTVLNITNIIDATPTG